MSRNGFGYCSFALAGLWAAILPFSVSAATPLSDRAAGRVLEQGTWGPSAADLANAQTMTLEQWLNAQFSAQVSDISDLPLLDSNGNTNQNLAPLQVQFFQNALNGQDQLRQRVAFALSEIWVVSQTGVGNASAFPPLLRIFRDLAFDNYENIMLQVTLNPAMGRYLNMVNNVKGNPSKGTSPNENYAREFMQLFTLGLTQLNMDGSPVLDSSGTAVPTYDQTAVTNMARIFTGWTYPPMPGATTKGNNPTYYLGQMVPVESNHDTAAKTIFGVTIPAGQTAEQDLKQAIHIIFSQPTMAPFVSQQMIQHLVTSNPSRAYVQRVSQIFADDGTGVRGNMQAVIAAILSDPEARAADDPGSSTNPSFGHQREPVLFLISLLRALGGTVGSNSTVYNEATIMGQQLFYQPSVFSYFSPQYRTSKGALAPELQIYTTQTAANRTDVVNAAVYGGKLDAGTTFNLTPLTSLVSFPDSFLAEINALLFHGAMSSELHQALVQAMGASSNPGNQAKDALYIALTSGEYQVIH